MAADNGAERRNKTRFISNEDDGTDQILSFALAHGETDNRSLILQPTLEFEPLLDQTQRGVCVSPEGKTGDARDFLTAVQTAESCWGTGQNCSLDLYPPRRDESSGSDESESVSSWDEWATEAVQAHTARSGHMVTSRPASNSGDIQLHSPSYCFAVRERTTHARNGRRSSRKTL